MHDALIAGIGFSQLKPVDMGQGRTGNPHRRRVGVAPWGVINPAEISRALVVGSGRRLARTTGSTHPSALSQAGVVGFRAQPALELGHHQAAGSGQVDLLLSCLLYTSRCV